MVEITAHRGSSAAAPENTIAAFRRAIHEQADWIELDVMQAGDRALVVVHDVNLKRLAGVDLDVHDLTLAELQALDVGSHLAPTFADERIPTLDAVIREVDGHARLNVELKTHGHEIGFVEALVETLTKAGVRGDALVTAADPALLRSIRRLDPDLRVGAVGTATSGDLEAWDVDAYSVERRRATTAFIRRAHARGREVHVWTVNDERDLRRMMIRGVDNVITDHPARARAVREALGRSAPPWGR